MPLETYVKVGNDLIGAVPTVPTNPTVTDRDYLEELYGTYLPGPETTGLISGEALNVNLPKNSAAVNGVISNMAIEGVVNPLSGGVAYSQYKRYVVPSNVTLYENVRFECPVFLDANSPADVWFRNCAFVFVNPQVAWLKVYQYDGADQVKEIGSGFVNYRAGKTAHIRDSLFDPGWWKDNGLSDRWSLPSSAGFHGGNYDIQHCEFRRMTDGVNHASQPCGVNQLNIFRGNWVHEGFYAHSMDDPGVDLGNYTPQDGGYTHADAFQFNTGINIWVEYNLFGGPIMLATARDANTAWPGGIVTDWGMDGILLQQEDILRSANTTTDAAYVKAGKLDNVHVRFNHFRGMPSAVIINYKQDKAFRNTLPGPGTPDAIAQNMTGIEVTDNKFEAPRINGWGQNMSTRGYEIGKDPATTTTVARNVRWDGTAENLNGTGVPVTIGSVT